MTKRKRSNDLDKIKGRRQDNSHQVIATPHALPPRLERTFKHLLSGDSEKIIAARMNISCHTLHGYVKDVYRLLGVRSRAELMAGWIAKSESDR